MLHLGGVLGRGMDDEIAILAWQGQRNLAFEIEMLLTTDTELGGQAMRRTRQGRLDLTALHGDRGLDIGLLHQRRRDIEDRLFLVDLDDGSFGGLPRGVEALRHHQSQRLTGMFDPVGGKQRLALAHRRNVVLARHVARRQHRHDTGRDGDSRKIELAQATAGHRAQHQRRVQGVRWRRHVVDIERLAHDMLQRAVVTARDTNRAVLGLAAHSASSSITRDGSASLSSSRRRRLAATCRR